MFDSEIMCTPPEMRESAQKLALNILPEIFATGAIVTPPQVGKGFISDPLRLSTYSFFYYF
jgi:hypothetical protein